MIQLDNTPQREEMSPEEIAAQEQRLQELPTIKELKQADIKIFSELDKLEQGQNGMNIRLDKGDKRMGGIEDKVERSIQMLEEYDSRAENRHKELSDKVMDNRYQDLQEEKKELKKEIEDGKKKRYDILKTIGVGIIMLAIGSLFGKLFG